MPKRHSKLVTPPGPSQLARCHGYSEDYDPSEPFVGWPPSRCYDDRCDVIVDDHNDADDRSDDVTTMSGSYVIDSVVLGADMDCGRNCLPGVGITSREMHV